MSNWTNATGIKPWVRSAVNQRDGWRCVLCWELDGIWAGHDLEMAHVVPRSRGGKGVETNLLLLCQKHHKAYDHNAEGHRRYKPPIVAYMQEHYPGWTEEAQIYHKHEG